MKAEVEIRVIEKAQEADIRIPNEPFSLFGRMIPSYEDEKWSYRCELWEKISEMTFPDENYDYDELAKNHIMVGAYLNGTCIGLAIWRREWFHYLYLYDLKVNKEYRRLHIAQKLITFGKKLAKENGYRGIWTQGQDNNLGACLFYINSGFRIGGINTDVYKGTKQEGKIDIYFFAEAEEE